jgi:hypothetical protein
MRLTSIRRGLLVLLAVPALSIAAALPAQAAQDFDLSTSRGGTFSGYAVGNGSVTFHNSSDYSVRATDVADRCGDDPNGDGAGAYLFMIARFMDGNTFTALIYKDTSGCSDGSADSGIQRFNFNKNVREVRLHLRECDDAGGVLQCSGNSLDNDVSNWKDNPHT